MGQDSKNQVLKVRKIQVPVQKTLQEDTETFEAANILAGFGEYSSSLRPWGQDSVDMTWPLACKGGLKLPPSCLCPVWVKVQGWGEKWSCPRTWLLEEEHQVGPGALSYLQPGLGYWEVVLGAKPSRGGGVQELMTTAYSPWIPPHQEPHLASCCLELCL